MIEGQLEIQMTASALDEEDTSQKQTLDPLNHGSRDEQKSKKSDAKASKGLRRYKQTDHRGRKWWQRRNRNGSHSRWFCNRIKIIGRSVKEIRVGQKRL